MNDTEPPSDPGYREDDTLIRMLKKASADHEDRIRKVEGWPLRWVLAGLAAAAGLVTTGVAGIQTLTRVEVAVEALSTRIERLEYQDDHRWRRVDTTTHATEGE